MADGTQLGRLLAEARAKLLSAGLEDAALEARLIVEHFTGTARIDAISNPDRSIESAQADAVWPALDRRLAGEPVHRILGYREFFGLPLRLSPDTLEPRPDTETLVHLVVPFVQAVAEREGTCRILDLGTGTGAIALALLDREPNAVAVGTDISAGALATARSNADMLGMGDRYSVVQSDWFDKVQGRFHLIVSNPPYIPSGELSRLQPEVQNHDPQRALDGGPDGLDAYRVIATGAADHLRPAGRIAVEIGHDQRASVTAIFRQAGFSLAGGATDLGGRDRALMWEL
jgi:release factor glutamine methyltransferase